MQQVVRTRGARVQGPTGLIQATRRIWVQLKKRWNPQPRQNGATGRDTQEAGFNINDLLAGRFGFSHHSVPTPALVEGLEERRLLAATVDFYNGALTVRGTNDATNTIKLQVSADGRLLTATANYASRSVLLSRISDIKIYGGDQADDIRVDARLTRGVFIDAKGGNDYVVGGSGNDSIAGGSGNDSIFGGNGNDLINAGSGNDLVYGQGGNDTLRGEEGNDSLYGEDGDDYVDGGSGTNVVNGGAGRNTLLGMPAPAPAPKPTPTPTPKPSETPKPTPTPTPTPGTNAPVVSIVKSQGTVIAGGSVFVNGLNTKLNSGTVLTAKWEWDFGDAGSKYNKLAGWNAAHYYADPGTYTVTLKVTDEKGKSATAQTQVVVSADTRRTIYVSASGNDAKDGSSADRAVKSITRVNRLLGSSSNVRVLFQRGDTFVTNVSLNLGGQNLLVGAYGSGNRPVLLSTSNTDWEAVISTYSTSDNVTIQDLKIDTNKGSSGPVYNVLTTYGIYARGKRITIRNNEFGTVGDAINANSSPAGLLVQDNVVPSATTLRGYFLWLQGTDASILGNKVANSTRQHIVRMTYYDRVLVAYNDFTNLDRTQEGDYNDRPKGCVVAQAGSHVYVANNKLTGGGVGVGPLNADNNASGERTSWAVVENNTTRGSHVALQTGAQHVMVRNNLLNDDNSSSIVIEGYSARFNREVEDVYLVNNVGLNYGEYGKFLALQGDATAITLKDNTFYAPSLVAGDGDHAAVDVQDVDLGSFTAIDGNTWMLKTGTYQPGVVFWIKNGSWSETAMYTISRWNALSVVGTDSVVDLKLGNTVNVGSLTQGYGAQPAA